LRGIGLAARPGVTKNKVSGRAARGAFCLPRSFVPKWCLGLETPLCWIAEEYVVV
jgi:hypothetical protein